ncbi:MAG: M20/M25/M40 family metallo-hydrolase, partial [Bacteroidota bacterium]
MSPKEIKSAVAPILSEMIAIRRHLHENPELSFHEVKTAAFISEHLTSWGIQHQTQIGGNGILATVTGELTGNHVIAIRGDMDALPIQETTNLPFASKNDGVMHACGHDVHTTCVLATARVLN